MSKQKTEEINQVDQIQSLELEQVLREKPKGFSYKNKFKSYDLYDSLISTNYQGMLFSQPNVRDDIEICSQQVDLLSFSSQQKEVKKKRGRPKKCQKIEQEYVENQSQEFEVNMKLNKNKKKRQKRLVKGDTKNIFHFFYKQVIKYLDKNSRKQQLIDGMKKTQVNRFVFFDLLKSSEFQPKLQEMFETRYLNREVILSRLPVQKKIFYLKKIQIFKDVFYTQENI